LRRKLLPSIFLDFFIVEKNDTNEGLDVWIEKSLQIKFLASNIAGFNT
jgi:hypothetical protein